jgi:hypothetical protein
MFGILGADRDRAEDCSLLTKGLKIMVKWSLHNIFPKPVSLNLPDVEPGDAVVSVILLLSKGSLADSPCSVEETVDWIFGAVETSVTIVSVPAPLTSTEKNKSMG